MSDHVSLRDAGLRVRDVCFSVVIVGLFAALAWWNFCQAGRRAQRLRICVTALHELQPGVMVQKSDLATRLRPVKGPLRFFNDPAQIVGRQVGAKVEQGAFVSESDLADPAHSRLASATFFVLVPPGYAEKLVAGDHVILVPMGKKIDAQSAPVFTVLEPPEAMPVKDKDKEIPETKLKLRAEYAEDAMRVLASSESAKFVPLVCDVPKP